jgi:polysaccharide export outer membrane protein
LKFIEEFMRRNTIVVLFALAVSVAGITDAAAQTGKANLRDPEAKKSGANTGSAKAAPAALPADTEYIIGPDDVLAVNVWKEPDLSRSVPVRSDGKITLPLIGDVEANGATPAQLQARLEQGLAEFISKPSVTVIVQEAKSHKFSVIGEVVKPGAYIISGPMTVLDALALAGGFKEWAKMKSIYILRAGPDGRQRIPFNYKQVVNGKAPDIQLKTRDTIVVP